MNRDEPPNLPPSPPLTTGEPSSRSVVDLGAPRNAALPPTNLAESSTPLIGRDVELAEVLSLCDTSRVVTITGAGGAGKTRLAEAVAAQRRAVTSEGVWWVDLAAVSAPELVGSEVFSVLGEPPPDPDPTVAFRSIDRDCMIVLDNAEHLLDPCATFVSALCRYTTSPRVVVTSREPLGLSGEQTWRIPSLASPPEGAEPAEVSTFPAVELFIARARQVRPGFVLTDGNAPQVASICRRLDGLPLAIELAAARVRMMSPGRILDGLDDRFRLLTGGRSRPVARQQTLRSSMEWSHDLLDQDARVVFRRLSVFVGGFTIEAADRVVADELIEAYAVLDLLSSLVDKSLVVADTDDRFRFLESVRDFAHEQLVAAGETEAVRGAHLSWVVDFVAHVEPHLVGPDQERWLARLDAEHGNLRAAFDWATAVADGEALWALAGSLGYYFVLGAHFAEAASLFEQAEVLGAKVDAAAQLPGRWGVAYASLYAGSFERAYVATLDLIERAETAGDDRWLARGLDVLGTMSLYFSFDEARGHLERSAALAETCGDDWCRCDALQVLAYSHLMQDDHIPARAALEASAPLDRRMGNHQLHAWQVIGEGWVELRTGRVTHARARCDEGLEAAGHASDLTSRGIAVCLLGSAAVARGRAAEMVPVLGAQLERCVERHAGLAVPALASVLGLCLAADGEANLGLDVIEREDVDVVRSELDRTVVQAKNRALIQLAAGDRPAAEATLDLGIRAAKDSGSAVVAADLGLLVAHLRVSDGETNEPYQRAIEAIEAVREMPVWEIAVDALHILARVAHLEGRLDDAARLLGAAQGVLDRAGATCTAAMAVLDNDAAAERQRIASGREELLAEGAGLDTSEMFDWVFRSRGNRSRPPSGWDSLTPTELAVANLVTEGLTNREIGERLFISAGTVKTHLAHIYAKSGMRNRTDVAAEVTRRNASERTFRS